MCLLRLPGFRKPLLRNQSLQSANSLQQDQQQPLVQNIVTMSPPPQQQTMITSGPPPLAIQHERLILELLPFKDSSKFQEWLHGDFVRGSWLEFYRDYMDKTTINLPEPDKCKTAQVAKDAINSRSQKYLMYHPEKTNWTAEDHYVRFIVTVVQDNMLKYLWSESEWKKKSIDIAKAVYEVLCYLKGAYMFAEQNPPCYTD